MSSHTQTRRAEKVEIFTIWIFREKSLLTVLYAKGTLLRCVYHEFSQQRVESRSMTDLTDTSVHVGSATCYIWPCRENLLSEPPLLHLRHEDHSFLRVFLRVFEIVFVAHITWRCRHGHVTVLGTTRTLRGSDTQSSNPHATLWPWGEVTYLPKPQSSIYS